MLGIPHAFPQGLRRDQVVSLHLITALDYIGCMGTIGGYPISSAGRRISRGSTISLPVGYKGPSLDPKNNKILGPDGNRVFT